MSAKQKQQTKAKFVIKRSEPVEVEAVGNDGVTYRLLLNLVIFDIHDTGKRVQPPVIAGGTGGDVPEFQFTAQIAAVATGRV